MMLFHFALKEKFDEIKNKRGETIFNRFAGDCNFQFARLSIEFDRSNDKNYEIFCSFDFMRLYLKIWLY